MNREIRDIANSDSADAIALVWRVFLEFEAPGYKDEGVAEFRRFLDGVAGNVDLRMKGCWVDGELVGVIAIRPVCHIALLFVDKLYHRKGIARLLFQVVINDSSIVCGHDGITVNSSPYAVDAYRRLGFVSLSEEQELNGIHFIPMRYDFREGIIKRLDGQEIVAFGMTLAELWQLFPIELVEHDPAWRDWYAVEESALNVLLGDVIERIDHIGSTAVEGLLAKPIVDILLQVGDDCDIDSLKDRLVADGWLLMAERTEPHLQLDFNKGYTPEGFATRVYHLHIRYIGDWDELHFRNYLIAHPETAAEYATLKQRLLADYKFDRDAYTEAKGDFIRIHTTRARCDVTEG
jgi:GrpB-like predicted nucleotidyltransferase (UPF0157 family)/GNAT superfamily N-acetyltransferase